MDHLGNHHDAWVNGADDPISGAVSLMEMARGLCEMLKTGWSPKRTIILALWDGEEWGLLGSTEWAEKHAAELNDKAAVYVNTRQQRKGLAQGRRLAWPPAIHERGGARTFRIRAAASRCSKRRATRVTG